jgi:hypothetical protein
MFCCILSSYNATTLQILPFYYQDIRTAVENDFLELI